MKNFSYENILQDVLTVEDLHLVSSEIDMLITSVFKADQEAFKNALNDKLHRNLSDSIAHSLSVHEIAYNDYTSLQRYFNGLKEFLTSLPVLQLTLAYIPKNEQLETISEAVRRQTGKPVILQIHHNPQMLGGAVITFEGRYIDLSLKKKLTTAYEANREEILRMLT